MWHMGIMFLAYIQHYGKYQDQFINMNEAEDTYISLDKIWQFLEAQVVTLWDLVQI